MDREPAAAAAHKNDPRAGIESGDEPATAVPLSTRNIFTQPRVTQSLVCAESVMPLSSEQEALCRRLEMGRPEPSAAALIRQQAHDIDELWDRLSRAYLAIRREIALSWKWKALSYQEAAWM